MKMTGLVVAAWIVLGLAGWVFDFLANSFFWVAVVAGGVWAYAVVSDRRRNAVTSGRSR